MCDCQLKFGKLGSLFQTNKAEKARLAKKLPQLLEKTKKNLAKKEKHHEEKTADTVFLNGKIYTMNQKEEVVTAVAIQGQNIISVGNLFDVLPLAREDTHFVDLQGKTLLPGFIDPHIHMQYTMMNDWVDLGPFVNSSIAQVKQKLIQAIKNAKKGDWIRAKLFDPTITPNKENILFDYSRWGLDKIVEDLGMAHMGLCIYIMEANGHIAYVNTAVLHASQIFPDTTMELGTFVKNQKGELTGQLQQQAILYMKKDLFPSDEQYYERNFRNFLIESAAKGVTSLHDAGIGIINPQDDIALLNSVFNPQQNPIIRFSGYLVSTAWDYWMQSGFLPEHKNPLLRISGIKCWSDGSLQGGTGYLSYPYLKPEWGVGKPNYTQQQLLKSITLALQRGWQVGVHGNGDAGIELILNAFQKYYQNNKKMHLELRNRIQHCTFIYKYQLERMKQLRLYPSFLIGHIYYYGDAFQNQILGEERADRLDPVKSAIELGLRPTIHSDYGCQPLDPIRCIYNAVTRIMRNTGDKVLNENECVTPYEAIKAMTIDAAWQSHIDDIVGSIEVGKKADFVILDRDPLTIPPKELINLKVVQTWMNGRVTFQKEKFKTSNFVNLLTSLKKKKHDHVEHPKKEEAHHH